MSGGRFDYDQYRIDHIADEIESVILKNKVEKDKKDLYRWDYDENGNVYEGSRFYYSYNEKTIERFKEAVKTLRKAAIYAQSIDLLLSSDYGESTFHKILEKELKKKWRTRYEERTTTTTQRAFARLGRPTGRQNAHDR